MGAIKKQTTEQMRSDRRLMQKKIGDFILTHRKSSGFSVEDLAQSLGIAADLLNEYELGHRKVPLNQIYGIANSLNISPEVVVRFFNQLSIEL